MQTPIGDVKNIGHVKRKLITEILRSIKGLSVRRAEPITGLTGMSISRLRRGLDRDYSLEALIRAAINIGMPILFHVGKPPPLALSEGGREGTHRPRNAGR